jgi:hypothetical protein
LITQKYVHGRHTRITKTMMLHSSSSSKNNYNIVQIISKSIPLYTITESQYLETMNDDNSGNGSGSCSSDELYPSCLIRGIRSANEIKREALNIVTTGSDDDEEEDEGLIKHTEEEDEKTAGTTTSLFTDDESDGDDNGEDSYEDTTLTSRWGTDSTSLNNKSASRVVRIDCAPTCPIRRKDFTIIDNDNDNDSPTQQSPEQYQHQHQHQQERQQRHCTTTTNFSCTSRTCCIRTLNIMNCIL